MRVVGKRVRVVSSFEKTKAFVYESFWNYYFERVLTVKAELDDYVKTHEWQREQQIKNNYELLRKS
jgi:hypothetical protein